MRNGLTTLGAGIGVVVLVACSGSGSPDAAASASGVTPVSASSDATLTPELTGTASASDTPTASAPQAVTSLATMPLYRRADSQAVEWVASHRGDRRAPTIASAVASRPTAAWFVQPDAAATARAVDRYVTAAARGRALPVLVLYALPNRDCGGASAGGTRTAGAYKAWVSAVAGALKRRPAMIIVEPDSLALQDCLRGTSLRERNSLVAYAAATLRRADPSALIYLDAGHSNWNSPADTARRLRAGGLAYANGFYTNVSNYRTTAAELAFGAKVRAALGSAGAGKTQVIDTARNGKGPLGSQWCDPPGRKVGTPPVRRPRAGVEAYLWVKPPGEADGCAARAGQFSPDLAYKLALGR